MGICPDAALLPCGVHVGLGRQRFEHRPFDIFEQHARCRVTRSLSVVTQSRIASFNSVIEKNRRLRSLAMIQRVASSTATSTLALSRGLYGRAGTIAVP